MKKLSLLTISVVTSVLCFSQGNSGNSNGQGNSGGQPGTLGNPDSTYYVDRLYVNDQIKIGSNSLYLSSTNSGADNSIYTDNGDLRINANEGQNPVYNTLINPQRSNVGIGLTNPASKLDINIGSDYQNQESGVRITVPIPINKGNIPGPNDHIFDIRRQYSTNVDGISPPYIMRTHMMINQDGQVGIGTSTPDAGTKLHIHRGIFKLTGNNAGGGPMMIFGGSATSAPNGEWGIEYVPSSNGNPGLNFWKPFQSTGAGFGNHYLFLSDNGNVSIGTDDSQGYKFAVKGNMIAEEVVVKLHADWPDFVFTEKYGLMDLGEVENYIDKNSHLPNVPSAKEIEEDGINLGEMDGVLLQKIEELTLYMIQLSKENQELKQKVETLQNEVKQIKK